METNPPRLLPGDAQAAPTSSSPSAASHPPSEMAVFYVALAKTQSAIRNASKDRSNEHTNSSYATLASVWDSCREALTSNGFCLIQLPDVDGAKVKVTTILAHESGRTMTSVLSMNARNPNAGKAEVTDTPHAIGSAITYARRYAMSAMVGVTPDDDDDGNAAQKHVKAGGGQPQKQSGENATDKARREFEEKERARKGAVTAPVVKPSGKVHPGKEIPDEHRVAHWIGCFTDCNTLDDLASLRAEFLAAEPQGSPLRQAVKDSIAHAGARLRTPVTDPSKASAAAARKEDGANG